MNKGKNIVYLKILFFISILNSQYINFIENKNIELTKLEIEHALAKKNSLLLDTIFYNLEKEDDIEKIVIFAHGTVKFNPLNQLHDELKQKIENRNLFYNIIKNNYCDCGKGKNRIEINSIESGFRGSIPGLVELTEKNEYAEMNEQTYKSIFIPIKEKNKKIIFCLFNWTGGISNNTRSASALEFVNTINLIKNKYPNVKIEFYGHSHAGSWVSEAAYIAKKTKEEANKAVNFLKEYYDLKNLIGEEKNIKLYSLFKNIKEEYFSKSISNKQFQVLDEYKIAYDKLFSMTSDFKIYNNKEFQLLINFFDSYVIKFLEKIKYNGFMHDVLLDKAFLIGTPMPSKVQKWAFTKNDKDEYYIKNIFSFFSSNDTVIDPYIGFPGPTSSKFYIKRTNQYNIQFEFIKKGKTNSLNHHDLWFNENLKGKEMKELFSLYINELINLDIEKAFIDSKNIKLIYSFDDKKFIYEKNILNHKYSEEEFFNSGNFLKKFLRNTKGIGSFLYTIFWTMAIKKRIESQKQPEDYYSGEEDYCS